jgi:hypothetical protein
MKKAKFRPHHIVCERFVKVQFPERGAEFQQTEQKLKDIIQADDEILVEVIEGVGELCRACPNCRDERCESTQGNEEATKKWDNIVLNGLGISYGETRTPKQWRMLIAQKLPNTFCEKRCPAKPNCTIFHLD